MNHLRIRALLRRAEENQLTLQLAHWAALLELVDREEYRERDYAPEPTVADPGSEAKIRVMRKRVADGYKPYHPGDLDLLAHEHLQRTAEKLNNGRRRLEAMQLRNGQKCPEPRPDPRALLASAS